MTDLFNQVCNMLIRPTRQTYHMYDLGNPIINTHGKRQDFQIFSIKNLKIKASFYQLNTKQKHLYNNCPTVIYLHSLNGSRLQFLSYIEPLMKLGFNVATFDFCGCGLSDGQYVTLGAHEKWDVLSVVKYLYKTYKIQNFIIWGRSMGAVAAVKFNTLFLQQKQQYKELENIKIQGLVLDSPFLSLNRLVIQIAKNKIKIPQIVIKVGYMMIQSSIEKKANFKTSELELEKQLGRIQIPTLIIASKKDTLVSYEHSLCIYNKIKHNEKQLMYIEAQHNSNRNETDIKKIFKFLKEKSFKLVYRRQQEKTVSANEIVEKRINCQCSSIQNSLQKVKSKSLKKYQNQNQTQQKLNRYQSQKNHYPSVKSNNFFLSQAQHSTTSSLSSFTQTGTLKKPRLRQFSHDKPIIQLNNQENQISSHFERKLKYHPTFFSSQRPKISFTKDHLHQSCADTISAEKNSQCIINKFSPILESIPQKQLNKKIMNHASSYKNIQCLKTVKKIKRLEPQQKKKFKNKELQLQKYLKQQHQNQDISKNHFNVITAKLKKKSKKGLTKSFLPVSQDDKNIISIENNKDLNIYHEKMNEKTLKKQTNAKSYTVLQISESFQNKKQKINENTSLYSKNFQYISSEKAITPAFFSNRQGIYNQKCFKPFTPQFPLNSSMKINQISHKYNPREQPAIVHYINQSNEANKGIKATLNKKNDLQQYKRNHILGQSLEKQYRNSKIEFMSSKKLLNSQIIQMRGENNLEDKRWIIARRKNQINQSENETSITLN